MILRAEDPAAPRNAEVRELLATVDARVDAAGDHALQLHGRIDLVAFGDPLGLLTGREDLRPQMARGVPGADGLAKARGDSRGVPVPVEAKLGPYSPPAGKPSESPGQDRPRAFSYLGSRSVGAAVSRGPSPYPS